ncbi:MAG: hypothetical protein HY898_01205 [Deltaproteobacteria bacterium]|nr:hypothetical protein [Deltaproteobacteria bacterium]
MNDFAYAVHTDDCTYLLDDTGICIWVLSANPSMASRLESCVGAQFVACLDERVKGFIVGELTEGASALLVATSKETGRAQLLRTGIIRRVQYRDPDQTTDVMPGMEVLDEVEIELEAEEDSAEAASHAKGAGESSGRTQKRRAAAVAASPPASAPKTQPKVAETRSAGATARHAAQKADAGEVAQKRAVPRPTPADASAKARPRAATPGTSSIATPRKPTAEPSDADRTLRIQNRKGKR